MPSKTLFLKTYGKQKRKLSAWISHENHKQAFDSSLSTDGDMSVFEPSRTATRARKTSVASFRAPRPAKTKALLSLFEKSLDEDVIPSPSFIQAAQQSKTSRKKKTSGSSDGAAHPSKRKAMLHLTKTSSDESISRPPSAQRVQQSKTSRALIRQKGQKFPITSESEEESSSTLYCRRNSDVDLPSAGRFVTRRRRPLAAKPTVRESSERAAETAGFAANPLRELSGNELADPSIRLRPREPFIFCSTPSAGLLCKRPRLTPLPIGDQSDSSPSKSVSRIGVPSPFQEALDSPGQPVSPQHTGHLSEEKLQPSFGEQEPSGDLFETQGTKERSTCAGRLEWLTEALKERCLTEPCAVQVQRLRNLSATPPCSRTARSPCFGKAKKTSLAPREKKASSVSADRPGTSRKACVSGLSVNRWRNKGNASTVVFGSRAAAQRGLNCSIGELIAQNRQPKELLDTTAVDFSTPMKASRLNLSSLLADFTPGKHTWSRLKAALSVHRKVLLTPKTPRLGASGCPGRTPLAELSQDLFVTPFRSLLPERLRSQIDDSYVEREGADLSDAEKVFAECGQRCPLPWEECLIPRCMKRCVKIGEGTFGEVFSTTDASGDTVALKVIPVEGSEQVNGEDQKTYGEILHEIIISKELSSLKEKQKNQTLGFIGLNNLHCVQGCYPPDFLNAWDAFDQQKGSENDRPDFFEKDQVFIILEFEFGGKDLENSNGTLASLLVAKSILHQVTAALAVAEQELHFEHRDLHWGNVLVKTTQKKKGLFLLNGAAHSFETKGVLVRIIDYSLSRLEIDDLTVSCDISKDEELFMGQGDYQFEIYRLMRRENGNNWSDYHPHTNILWLHYLSAKLLSIKYRSSAGKAVKDMREALTRFHDNVLQYSSATEALQACPMFQ